MNAKTVTDLLDALASRFGTSAAHLWAVLVRQVYIDAIEFALFYLVLGAAIVQLFRYMTRATRTDTMMEQRRYASGIEWNASAIIACVMGCLLSLMLFGYLPEFANAIAHLFNPEYGALEIILKAVKGV